MRCRGFLPLLILALTLLLPPLLARAAQPPTINLEISFDLERSQLNGTAIIYFPARGGDLLHLPGLTITGLWIDDKAIDLADRKQPCFADPDHEVTIAISERPQKVKITYTLTQNGRDKAGSDLIGPTGISLTGNWHPLLHQDAYFHLRAVLPPGFSAVSEAEQIEIKPAPSGDNVSFNFAHPLANLNLIAGPYVVERANFGEGRELYTYFFAEDRELAADYRDKALAYLDRYEAQLGPFPYQRFSIVENRLPTGYAMPTFTVLGQSVVRLPFITDTSLGHEIVHQWFGNSVRPDDDGNWSEGLATLLADQQYQIDQGKGSESRKQQLTAYLGYVHGDNTLTLKQFSGGQSHLANGQEAARAVGYTKGSMVLHTLRKQLGEEKFLAGLRDFYQRFKHQRAGWSDLKSSFETVSGATLDDFFKQWLERPDLPSLGITKTRVNEEEGRPVLRLTISQFSSAPYRLTVPLRVITDAGDVTRDLDISAKDIEAEIPLPAQPRSVVLDENYDLPRQLNIWEMAPVWSRFSGAPKKLAVVDANGGKELYAPLLTVLKELGCRVVGDEEVKESDLAEGAVIFLGTASQTARRLFATPLLPAEGFTVEVRTNPLNDTETAVLVAGASVEEVERAAYKLRHYGKYSYLHFEAGQLREKKISDSEKGQIFSYDEPPGGLALPERLSFDAISARLKDTRVVYLGETHTRYEDHLLQLRMIRAMYHQNPELAIGMEMFNRVDQPILDRYVLEQSINETEFLRQSHYFSKWSFDYRYYRDLINFARANRIPVVALNLDKETVSAIYQGKGGLDGLAKEQRASLPPERDLSLPDYRERLFSFYMMHQQQPGQENKFNDFLESQALWDEAMAETAADYLRTHPERRMAVLAGRGHVEKENGIPPRLVRRIEVSQAILLNTEPREITGDSADFVLFSPPAELPPPAMMGVVLRQEGERVLIDDVSPQSPAMRLGLQKGDIFLALDGQTIKTIEDIKIVMFFKRHGGDKVKVKLLRPRRIFADQVLEVEIPL